MKRWKVWLGLVVVFCSGVVVGGIGAFAAVKHRLDYLRTGGPAAIAEVSLEKLQRRLELSAEQASQLKGIIAKMHQNLHDLRQQHAPEVRAIIVQSLAEMNNHLSEAQRNALAKAWEEAQERAAWLRATEKEAP